MKIVEEVSWTVFTNVEWHGKLFEDGTASMKCGDRTFTGSRNAGRGSKEYQVWVTVHNHVLKMGLPEKVYVVSENSHQAKHFADTMERPFGHAKNSVVWVDDFRKLQGMVRGQKLYLLGDVHNLRRWVRDGGRERATAAGFELVHVPDW